MELRLYPSLVIGFGQLYQIYSNKPAHFLFSKTILIVGRARAVIVDFAKYIYHRLGTKHDMYQSLFLNGCNIFSLNF